MGQAQSRRTSTSSQTLLNPGLSAEKVQEAFYSSANPQFRDDLVSHNVITRPVRPSHTYRFSELIDPHDLLGLTADDAIMGPEHLGSIGPPNVNKRLPKLIESPSGHTLGPHEFIGRPDRPLAIRERQENIRQAVENASRNASRNGSLGSVGPGRMGSVGSEKTGSRGSKRNGSVGTCRSNMTFEENRIEEGRRAYEEKMRIREERKGGRRHGCFTGCFGTRE